jgi:glycosyltransferase involved in cell wall biosynthesis
VKIILFANTDWYLYNFRLSTALQLQSMGVDVLMVSPPGEFGARFETHGIAWKPLLMDRASLGPLREAATVSRLVRLLKDERPDLLHSFTLKCAVYGALAARLARVPAVVSAVTGLGFVYASDSVKARLLRPLVSLLMRSTLGGGHSRVILQNGDDAKAFETLRLAPVENIRLIRSSGVNVDRFEAPTRDALARQPLRVLLAARLVWEKGIGEFVEAARALGRQGRTIEFHLAGSPDPGNPSSVTHAQVSQWHAEGLLHWHGHVDDMPALLRTMDVMALPSYYREGVPKSLIEAAACGVALITTDLPGCREVVSRDGDDGLHVIPRDAKSLADALVRLDEDRALLARLASRARERALTDFDERIVIRRTCEVYGELLRLPAQDLSAATP